MKLRVLEGKNTIRRQNKYIDDRINHENKMNIGKKVFKPSEEVLKDSIALKQFKRITKIYKEFEFVSDVDNDIINRYCLLCSDLDEIYAKKREIERCPRYDTLTKCELLNKSKIMSDYLKMLDLKLKYEDKLFLNPAARLRSLPKKEEQKPENYLDKMGLNNI